MALGAEGVQYREGRTTTCFSSDLGLPNNVLSAGVHM